MLIKGGEDRLPRKYEMKIRKKDYQRRYNYSGRNRDSSCRSQRKLLEELAWRYIKNVE